MSQEWKDEAFATVVKVAESMREFTPDDIWDFGLEKPLEARALGGIMRSAKARGIIEKTGRVAPTRQKESHSTDVTVWKSNIFKG
ncbi:MAG: hypothetical protein ACJAZP_001101 [Psychromonas sp.]|jgi:hypothetical protein|uniref:hypothetical protein n=1 Tax=Psychromonas sp. TaxID=1884585 RepID=UPI0039E42BC4